MMEGHGTYPSMPDMEIVSYNLLSNYALTFDMLHYQIVTNTVRFRAIEPPYFGLRDCKPLPVASVTRLRFRLSL